MIAAIIQARTMSTRLPNKILLPINDKPILYHFIERVRDAQKLDDIIVATSTKKSDDIIEKFCIDNEIKCFRG